MKPTVPSGLSCDICGRPCDRFLVCSLPAFPISLNHCEYCLSIGAMPLYTAEVTLSCDDESNLFETIQKIGLGRTKAEVAEWFLESLFWIGPEVGIGPGRYMSLRAYLNYLAARL